MIDPYRRKQSITLQELYPGIPGLCSCGCGERLTGRKRRWARKRCVLEPLRQYWIIQGNTSVIRAELYKIDKGICRVCKIHDQNWQADHLIPVCLGGGGCTLDGYQTLCLTCHKIKTKKDVRNCRGQKKLE